MARTLRGSAIAIAISATVFAAPCIAADTDWQPAGQWKVNYGQHRCTASRLYRADDERLLLMFQPNPINKVMELLVQARGSQRGIDKVKARVNAGGDRLKTDTALLFPSATAGMVVYKLYVAREELLKLAESQHLDISVRPRRFGVPLKSFEAVVAKLDECVAVLLETWGLSRDDQARLSAFPEMKVRIRPSDYPDKALNENAVGGVGAVVTVAADGNSSGCRITESSGHDSLDQRTCELLHGAQFEPARDAAGQPMRSPYYFRINWLIMNW